MIVFEAAFYSPVNTKHLPLVVDARQCNQRFREREEMVLFIGLRLSYFAYKRQAPPRTMEMAL
jgi:hypothetical protein